MSARLPLEGVRIVDMTLAWVGPFGTQLLADWGAEVIRVEPIGIFQYGTRATGIRPADRGLYDWASSYPDSIPGERHWNRNTVFQIHGRNKLSMTSNLPKPDIMDTHLQLASISDVVIENNVPQTYDKIGASYDQTASSQTRHHNGPRSGLRAHRPLCRVQGVGSADGVGGRAHVDTRVQGRSIHGRRHVIFG